MKPGTQALCELLESLRPETLRSLRKPTAEDLEKTILKARIGRKIKLSPEARLAHRRKMNSKAARAWRERQLAQGLTCGGKKRTRPLRVKVSIAEVRPAEEGGTWLRITPTLYKFRCAQAVVITLKP